MLLAVGCWDAQEFSLHCLHGLLPGCAGARRTSCFMCRFNGALTVGACQCTLLQHMGMPAFSRRDLLCVHVRARCDCCCICVFAGLCAQVTISYGLKSSGELLLSYGFFPPPGSNPLQPSWPLRQKSQTLPCRRRDALW